MAKSQLRVAVFGGAEWVFPGAAEANGAFRRFLAGRLGGDEGIAWNEVPEGEPVVGVGFSWGAMRMSLVPQQRLVMRIAVDGWCVPLGEGSPVFRLSHDWETHLNGLMFGGGEGQFYADPAVEHLRLWACPGEVVGWGLVGDRKYRTTAGDFLWKAIAQTHWL